MRETVDGAAFAAVRRDIASAIAFSPRLHLGTPSGFGERSGIEGRDVRSEIERENSKNGKRQREREEAKGTDDDRTNNRLLPTTRVLRVNRTYRDRFLSGGPLQ